MTDTLPPGASSEDVESDLAAELALGVLDAPERAAAERRVQADPAFAREVEAWSLRLARIAYEAPAREPSPRVWPRIEIGLPSAPGPGNVVEFQLRRSLTVWRSLAAGAGAIAAGLAVVLALPHGAALIAPSSTPVVAQAGSGVLETASLSSTKGGQIAFIALYDPQRRELVLTPATLGKTPGRSPQLWVIPTGGKPVSLGVGQFGKPVRLKVDALKAVGETQTLAVSLEPEGGSPTGQPTGPVVATGQLQAL